MRVPRWGPGMGAAVLAFLLVAPPGLGVTGAGVVQAAMPIDLWGTVLAEADGGLAARAGDFDAVLLLQRGEVRLTTLEAVLGPLGGVRRTTEVVAGDGARLHLAPAEAAQVVGLGWARLHAPTEARLALPQGLAFAVEHGGEVVAVPYGGRDAMVQATRGVGRVEGDLHAFLTGGVVRLARTPADLEDLDLAPAQHLRALPSAGPLGQLPDGAALLAEGLRRADLDPLQVQQVLLRRVLEVEGEGVLVVRATSADLHVFGEAPAAHVVGALAMPRAAGEVVLAGTPVVLRGESLQAAGDLHLRAMPGEGPQRRVGMGGDVDSFAVGGRLVEARPLPGAALALGAVAALGFAWPLAARALGAFYARIPPSEVLGHEVRRRLFELVQREPGLSLSDLSGRSGLSWGNTVHHLAVLKRSGLVVSMRHGRYRRWFVAGGTEQERRPQVAALRNVVTARIARLVLDRPGLSQKQLADALGMTPQATHWHLARLAQAGLVERVRDGREVRHFVRAAPPPLAAPHQAQPAPAPTVPAAGPSTRPQPTP
jgi:DNA-binding transcriptional ArsR family regulator